MPSPPISRRQLLQTLSWGTPWLLMSSPAALMGSGAARTKPALDPADDALLEEVARATFQYFIENTHPETGLVRDRCHVQGEDRREVASVAATGFGLSALCIADERRWLKPGEAAARAREALRFLRERMPQEHGFFYHFVNWCNGEREWRCELSSIDTAILICGVLACRQHFHDRQIRRLAQEIYERVDWEWMLNGQSLLAHGWKPESGFLKARWDTYCEHMLLYLLAIGARRHAIPAAAWEQWKRPQVEYRGWHYLSPREPIFVHQYSHAWFDFRNQRDRHADYFANSVIATQAHQAFCAGLAGRWPHFSRDVWGITASDSTRGYVVWGGPPELGELDGTLVPSAVAGSLPFLLPECLRCLRNFRERYASAAWTRFGLADAFNPATGWVGPDVIGINAGISLLMMENARTGFVWNIFMKNPEVRHGMKLVGFRKA